MIHPPAEKRILQPVNSEGLLSIFKALMEEAEEEGREVGQCCMPYIEEEDEFKKGAWVPELWLVVRKVLE